MLTRSSSVNSVIATHRRMISAPLSLMMSCGTMVLPTDFDILRPSRSIRKPCVSTCLIRRAPARGQRHEQRALEPAAVLVAALEVHVRRPRRAGRSAAARPRGSTPSRTTRRECPARARTMVPPHFGQARPSGRNSSIGRSYQASAPCCSKSAAARSDQRRREHRLAARRAVHGGNRHAPGALARDAPVGPVRHHVEDAVAAPRRDPLHLVIDGVLRGGAQRAALAVFAR